MMVTLAFFLLALTTWSTARCESGEKMDWNEHFQEV